MLTEVCNFVHNYFILETYEDEFEISGGTIPIELLDGQRFRIQGSALNDGIYTYHSAGIKDDDDSEDMPLSDETFTGTIDAMGVPVLFKRLVKEIAVWVETNSAVLNSPYTSESFNGYSYSKASGSGSGSSSSGVLSWQDMFKARLNAYRKIA